MSAIEKKYSPGKGGVDDGEFCQNGSGEFLNTENAGEALQCVNEAREGRADRWQDGPGRVATDSFFKDRGQALRIEALHQVIHQVIAHRRCRRLGGTDRVLIGQVQEEAWKNGRGEKRVTGLRPTKRQPSDPSGG